MTRALLDALRMPTSGTLYDLGSGWFRGMPGHPAHPTFDVVTYRTPQGQRLHADLALTTENNTIGFGFVSELVMGTTHTGTHVDAPCHIVVDGEYHGGRLQETLGDFGTVDAHADASALPHMIQRGVLLDVPAALGYETLPSHFPIGPNELEATCRRQGTEVTPGTIVLVRTGQMKHWPDAEAMQQQCHDAGVNLAGAQWLVDRGAAGVGADTPAIEVAPSGVEGSPQPVHVLLIVERGLPILEWVYLEEIARDGVHEFLFIGLPLRVRGATGSMLAPVAIV